MIRSSEQRLLLQRRLRCLGRARRPRGHALTHPEDSTMSPLPLAAQTTIADKAAPTAAGRPLQARSGTLLVAAPFPLTMDRTSPQSQAQWMHQRTMMPQMLLCAWQVHSRAENGRGHTRQYRCCPSNPQWSPSRVLSPRLNHAHRMAQAWRLKRGPSQLLAQRIAVMLAPTHRDLARGGSYPHRVAAPHGNVRHSVSLLRSIAPARPWTRPVPPRRMCGGARPCVRAVPLYINARRWAQRVVQESGVHQTAVCHPRARPHPRRNHHNAQALFLARGHAQVQRRQPRAPSLTQMPTKGQRQSLIRATRVIFLRLLPAVAAALLVVTLAPVVLVTPVAMATSGMPAALVVLVALAALVMHLVVVVRAQLNRD